MKRAAGCIPVLERCRAASDVYILVCACQNDYYACLSQYQRDSDEVPMSSGVFINAGCGHVASWHDGQDELEAVVVQELALALLAHLPMPHCLHAGFAVNVERALLPRCADPRLALYRPTRWPRAMRHWWNARTIQAFRSSAALHTAGVGAELAYELAREITALAARADEAAFRAFAATADRHDTGRAAAIDALGYPPEYPIEAMLGEGGRALKPELWIAAGRD